MHAAAMKGFTENLAALPGSFRHASPLRVLDLGGADVNGTVHATLAGFVELDVLDVLDIQRGAGVTIVGDARRVDWWDGTPYDLVISTEMLEHLSQWGASIEAVRKVLRPGGWFVGTAASIGRRPHGARGEYDPPDGEWYENVEPSDLATELIDMGFEDCWVQYEHDRSQPHGNGDVYWRAQRSAD